MTKSKFRLFVWSLLAMLGMAQGVSADATFHDFSVDLVNILTDEQRVEKQAQDIYVAIAEDGTATQTEATEVATNVVSLKGTYWNSHGWTNTEATVKVDGPVQIDLGYCNYGSGDITVLNAEGTVVATGANVKDQGCWSTDATDKVATVKYTGEATTLTIKYASYLPYIAVKAIEASSVEVSYSLGSVVCEGSTLPAGGTYAAGDEYTIPAKNFTLYKEGYTLTGWTDGTNEYAAGSKITLPSENITLTPVFTENTVNLSDRTEPVTVKFDFQRNNGAPSIQWQGQTDLVWVAQAEVNGKTIDVATHFSTSPGKFNNTNWGDWCQINDGTTFAVPSCKGATISVEAYNELSKLTIDGQNNYTSGKTISYEVANTAETVNVVFSTEGSYYRYIQTVLPVPTKPFEAKTYENEAVTVEWPFAETTTLANYTSTVDDAISVASTSYSPEGATVGTGARSADPDNGMQFITFTGENVQLHWYLKPVLGLTFTPTQVKMNVQRFGTNKENGVVVSAKAGDNGTLTTLGTFTARRANWTTTQENTQFNWTTAPATLVNELTIDLTAEQQVALASGEGLHLYATTGLGSTKAGGFSDIRVSGLLNGTTQDVNKYTLAVAPNIEEAGSVNIYPASETYEEGTEVTLTATDNFGYNFVNWTNAAGEELSTSAQLKLEMTADSTITANFVKVNTYELNLTVDGTNDYMVKISPAPTVVDGKNMYEEGTAVQLTADQYDGLVTFTNWSSGETASSKLVSMTEDINLTAFYAESDIIAGWDFYKAGGNGRKADFAAQDNDADALNLVNTSTGETSGWLDKSTLGGGGYESFTGAAVNWRAGASNGDVGNWHWQTKVNAEAFKDVNVQFQMLYNYNAYQTYKVEYSLDGTTWTTVGSVTMGGTRQVGTFNGTLPEACNNQKDLYIRMIADKTSSVDGSASANDGNTLAMFFITGTPELVNDGTAPVLVSTVPVSGATGASATGKIVLTFDERVKLAEGAAATLGTETLTPVVSGKTVTFSYKGLEYSNEYTFNLPANSVADLTDNFMAEPITLSFTTMVRPAITKQMYDAVVGNVDELLAAINAAQSRSDKNVRYRIFVKNGEYTIPLKSTMKTCNGYEVPECITFINTQNLSLIGESRDGVIITNGIDKNATFTTQYGTTSKYDGIGNSDVFQISGSDYYFQDLTIETGMDDGTGRDLAIHDKAVRTIYKNTGLRGFQDTWTSNNDNGLFYFEGGYLRGRTDYMCGKGDAFFNGVELRQIYGGYAAVPSKPKSLGWIYKDCVINGEESPAVRDSKTNIIIPASEVDGNYTLGRPWGSGTPTALFIDTKMNVVPSAIGWNEMSGGWPARFAEFNSMTSTGSTVDLSGRKTQWYKEEKDSEGKTINTPVGDVNNPVLTAEEALYYGDMSNMFGEWDPTLLTEQAPSVKNVVLDGSNLTWDDSDYALLYAIVKDGDVVAFTTENSFDISTLSSTLPHSAKASSLSANAAAPVWAVRAANEMGGLNEAVEATKADAVSEVKAEETVSVSNGKVFNVAGQEVSASYKGIVIIDGKKVIK